MSGDEITTSNLERKFRKIVEDVLTDQHGNLGNITYRHLEFTNNQVSRIRIINFGNTFRKAEDKGQNSREGPRS